MRRDIPVCRQVSNLRLGSGFAAEAGALGHISETVVLQCPFGSVSQCTAAIGRIVDVAIIRSAEFVTHCGELWKLFFRFRCFDYISIFIYIGFGFHHFPVALHSAECRLRRNLILSHDMRRGYYDASGRAAFQAAVVERRPLMPPVVFKQRFD